VTTVSPKKDLHIQVAKHNEEFATSFDLKTTKFRDWAVTVYFYTALHYVEAYLDTQNFHSADHRTRDTAMARFAGTKPIFNDYSELKNHSINARYYGKRFSEDDVVKEVQPSFKAVKDHLTKLL